MKKIIALITALFTASVFAVTDTQNTPDSYNSTPPLNTEQNTTTVPDTSNGSMDTNKGADMNNDTNNGTTTPDTGTTAPGTDNLDTTPAPAEE